MQKYKEIKNYKIKVKRQEKMDSRDPVTVYLSSKRRKSKSQST